MPSKLFSIALLLHLCAITATLPPPIFSVSRNSNSAPPSCPSSSVCFPPSSRALARCRHLSAQGCSVRKCPCPRAAAAAGLCERGPKLRICTSCEPHVCHTTYRAARDACRARGSVLGKKGACAVMPCVTSKGRGFACTERTRAPHFLGNVASRCVRARHVRNFYQLLAGKGSGAGGALTGVRRVTPVVGFYGGRTVLAYFACRRRGKTCKLRMGRGKGDGSGNPDEAMSPASLLNAVGVTLVQTGASCKRMRAGRRAEGVGMFDCSSSYLSGVVAPAMARC